MAEEEVLLLKGYCHLQREKGGTEEHDALAQGMSLSVLTIQHKFWKSQSIREIRNGICWLGTKAGLFLKAFAPGHSTLQLNATSVPVQNALGPMVSGNLIITERGSMPSGAEKISSFPCLLQHARPTLLLTHCGHPQSFWDVWKPLGKHPIFLPAIALHQPKGTSRNLQILLAASCCSRVSLSAGLEVPLNCPGSLTDVCVGVRYSRQGRQLP